MGFLGLFGKKSGPAVLKKHAPRAANKRAQALDRMESIEALAALGTPEAVEALLARFTFVVDPSIVDQEEKDIVFRAVIDAGRENAVVPLRAFLRKQDAIAWSLKCLDRLLSPEEVVLELLVLLEKMDTEYERDPQKKVAVLAELEDRQNAQIVEAVARFLTDVNETVRFHATGAILAQAEAESARDALLDALAKEDSVRVRARILDGFVAHKWPLGDRLETLRPKLPGGYAVDSAGIVSKG